MSELPVQMARALAEEHGLRQVIIVAWDGALTHVVTYGVSASDSDQAAVGGNRIKRALGWPETLQTESPKVTALRDEIAGLRAEIDHLKAWDEMELGAEEADPGHLLRVNCEQRARIARLQNDVPGLLATLDEYRHFARLVRECLGEFDAAKAHLTAEELAAPDAPSTARIRDALAALPGGPNGKS